MSKKNRVDMTNISVAYFTTRLKLSGQLRNKKFQHNEEVKNNDLIQNTFPDNESFGIDKSRSNLFLWNQNLDYAHSASKSKVSKQEILDSDMLKSPLELVKLTLIRSVVWIETRASKYTQGSFLIKSRR